MVIVPGMGGSIDKGYLYICEVFSSEVVQRYLEGSPVRTSVSSFICIAPMVSSGRVMAVAVGRSLRAFVSSLWPMVFDGGFRVREADAETDGKCHRGQARRARQEPDALRVEREIRVFPALAQTHTKKDRGHDLDACLGESVGFMERSDSGTE